jgi:hypothetical protein
MGINEDLERVVAGEKSAHYWVSEVFPGAKMNLVFADAEAEVAEGEHDLPLSFAADVGLQYGGQLTREEAADMISAYGRAILRIDQS